MQVAPGGILQQLVSGVAGTRPDASPQRPETAAAPRAATIRDVRDARPVLTSSEPAQPRRNLPRGSLIDIKV